jgi:hypothetical protein
MVLKALLRVHSYSPGRDVACSLCKMPTSENSYRHRLVTYIRASLMTRPMQRFDLQLPSNPQHKAPA